MIIVKEEGYTHRILETAGRAHHAKPCGEGPALSGGRGQKEGRMTQSFCWLSGERNGWGRVGTWSKLSVAFVIVAIQSLSHVWLSVIPWTAAHQASLSFTISQSSLKLMSIESVMPSNHLILCHPLLLLPSIFPSIRVFSSESALSIRWPEYWNFSFSISPSSEYSGLISFRID